MRREELSLPQPPADDRPGDRWVCGRADGQPPCAQGPSARGICTRDSPCRPKRTWHGRRKTISLGATAILIAVLVAMTSSRYSAVIFKPGDLATPHAQILAGTVASNRCAACHPEAGETPLQWFFSSGQDHAGVSQTDRCLDCHHTAIAPETAKLAHNLPYRIRADLRLASVRPMPQTWHDRLPGPSIDQEDLQCGACHREHRGADSNLLEISDSQCQTCHVDRFGSFAQSHPQWDRWPYGRGGEISFNHATHANKHFPATARGLGVARFQCVNCHRPAADNELTRSTSYEQACQSCHDRALQVAAAEGIELLALPTLSTESADKVGSWPPAATGFYDGKVTPIAQLLMRADEETAAAIRQLSGQDFAHIDPLNSKARRASEVIARAHRQLVEQIAQHGQQAIIDRLAYLNVPPRTLTSFLQSLSPQLVAEAGRRWFGESVLIAAESAPAVGSAAEVRQVQHWGPSPASRSILISHPDEDDLLGGDELREGDPLGGDPLLEDPLAIGNDQPADARDQEMIDQMLPAGGWFRDDLRLAIRYRGGGHDDPVLKSTIEWISRLSPDDVARQQLLKTPAVTACVSCHPGAVSEPVQWRSNPLIGRRSEFTKFTHSPHLNVAQLTDCRHCHRVDEWMSGEADASLASGLTSTHEFVALGRHACIGCHTSAAAGDACTTCHRYHIDLR